MTKLEWYLQLIKPITKLQSKPTCECKVNSGTREALLAPNYILQLRIHGHYFFPSKVCIASCSASGHISQLGSVLRIHFYFQVFYGHSFVATFEIDSQLRKKLDEGYMKSMEIRVATFEIDSQLRKKLDEGYMKSMEIKMKKLK